MRRLARDESGQAAVLAAALMTMVCALLAGVVDVGSWYEQQRQAQSAADAAALAAVQALPGSPSAASALAAAYVARNGGGTPSVELSPAGDAVTVTVAQPAPVYFARLFGLSSVTVHARATAQASAVAAAADAVPVAVSASTSALACGDPCFGQETTLTMQRLCGSGGAFGFIDFSGSPGVGTPTLASWLANGYPGTLPIGDYGSVPGNRYNAGPVRSALAALAAEHRTVLVPVYSGLRGSTYTITGFAAFRIDAFSANGATSTITGSFQRAIRHGTPGQGGVYYGVTTDRLTS